MIFNRGFSLIEMAFVLVIITLLLGGLLVPFATQVEQRRIAETNKAMEEIKEALLGYAVANRRLPCPDATGNAVAPNTNNDGQEDQTGNNCDAKEGNLPWVTLGVSNSDAWGNRFTYRVTSLFASGVAPGTSAAFTLSSTGDITIKESTTGNTIAPNTPVIVLSHGVNACGAYLPSGTRIDDDTATPPPIYCTDADQQENSDGNATFISKTTTSTFDDLVLWVSTNTLISRMVSAGKLP